MRWLWRCSVLGLIRLTPTASGAVWSYYRRRNSSPRPDSGNLAFAKPLDSVSFGYSVRGVPWESHAGTIGSNADTRCSFGERAMLPGSASSSSIQPRHALEPDREPPIGAHIITPRRGYTHHGIYI